MIRMRLRRAAEDLGVQLASPDTDFHGVCTDSRVDPRGRLFVALRGTRVDGHEYVDHAFEHGAAAALVSRRREYAGPTLAVADTGEALVELARRWRRRFTVQVTAITGSNGKTTVKEMLAAIQRVEGETLATHGNLNNEIGMPLMLMELDEAHRAAVIELGANHAGEIARLTALADPAIGVITQCAPAHLAGFGSVDGVARAKGELFEHMRRESTAVINADDAFSQMWGELAAPRNVIRFGLDTEVDVGAGWSQTPAGARLMLRTPIGSGPVELSLPGRHNVMNALAASAAATAAGASFGALCLGLESVRPVAGRLQPKSTADGITIIDDTYNANPASLRAGLEVLAACRGRRWLVLGDMAELGADERRYHEDAGEMAKSYGVERLYTTGPLSEMAAKRFGCGAIHCSSRCDLIEALRDDLPGDTTVLVKGSRSMQMEVVVQALTELPKNEPGTGSSPELARCTPT